MTLTIKQWIIGFLGVLFLASLVLVQYVEVSRRRVEAGLGPKHISVPASSQRCVDCHQQGNPGVVAQWRDSTHAEKGVGCYECHRAEESDADAWRHEGYLIAAVVTPRDCARCHDQVAQEFERSHHAAAGNILASLDNFLAEVVEGARLPFDPHSKTPGRGDIVKVNGMASVSLGCMQCHGSKIALTGTDGTKLTCDDFKPDQTGKPTNLAAVAKIAKNKDGKPLLDTGSWPNTGIGRLNLDGSRGSCSACHSRHDFSPRRARQPESCGKCHLGPDHPQKEIYEESKHGIAYRDLREKMGLDSKSWILGKDYTQAPTCATCHMSGHSKNGGRITHDVGERISWTNRPPISLVLDTDVNGKTVTEADPDKRRALIGKGNSAAEKRDRMKEVCANCHTGDYVTSFYKQYDDLIVLFNEKFAKPGKMIVEELRKQKIISTRDFDDEIEWTWYYLWHHEGRRARHGASMMAPDYTHWHGMYEVAERFYQQLIPQAKELCKHAAETGNADGAKVVTTLLDSILTRPEHAWTSQR